MFLMCKGKLKPLTAQLRMRAGVPWDSFATFNGEKRAGKAEGKDGGQTSQEREGCHYSMRVNDEGVSKQATGRLFWGPRPG